jgi:hypothetical protein
MGNKYYESMMGQRQQQQQPAQQMQGNGLMNTIERFNKFRQTLTGDPKEQVMNLVSSGQVTKEQYDQAVQMANMFRGIF